jgi:hypothetical protein
MEDPTLCYFVEVGDFPQVPQSAEVSEDVVFGRGELAFTPSNIDL